MLAIHLQGPDDAKGIFHGSNVVLGVVLILHRILHRLLVCHILPKVVPHRHLLAVHPQRACGPVGEASTPRRLALVAVVHTILFVADFGIWTAAGSPCKWTGHKAAIREAQNEPSRTEGSTAPRKRKLHCK